MTTLGMRACLHDARWAYEHHNDPAVLAYAAKNPEYRDTVIAYVQLGAWLATGVSP